jgi:nucleoside triphosphatase
MYPEPTVGALIINDSNEILLISGKKFKNFYVIPGGHIEYGETMKEAVIREVFEETGLKIKNPELFSLQDAIFPEAYHKKKHFIYIDFICRTKETEVKLNHEAEKYIWIKPEKIKDLKVEYYTKTLIEKYLINMKQV